MRGNFSGLLAQAQKMQKNVERAQAELANIEVTGEAGAGMVKITVTCKHEAKRVEIDPSLLSGSEDDKEMLEDLIAAAINDAAHKAEAAAQIPPKARASHGIFRHAPARQISPGSARL